MATYVWEGRARSGEVRRGTVEAENAEIVVNRLKTEQLSNVKVTKKGRSLADIPPAAPAKPSSCCIRASTSRPGCACAAMRSAASSRGISASGRASSSAKRSVGSKARP